MSLFHSSLRTMRRRFPKYSSTHAPFSLVERLPPTVPRKESRKSTNPHDTNFISDFQLGTLRAQGQFLAFIVSMGVSTGSQASVPASMRQGGLIHPTLIRQVPSARLEDFPPFLLWIDYALNAFLFGRQAKKTVNRLPLILLPLVVNRPMFTTQIPMLRTTTTRTFLPAPFRSLTSLWSS